MKKPHVKAKLHKVDDDLVWVFTTIPRKYLKLPQSFYDKYECRITALTGILVFWKKIPGYIYNFHEKRFQYGEY